MSAGLALSARDLHVERGGHPALRGLSFDVEPGEVFALLGGNGAGKSTTLLTFLGFCSPARGEALIHGVRVDEDVVAARRQTAYLPESGSLYPHLTARENVQYFLALGGLARSAEEIEAALDEVDLAASARSRALAQYSKGMRQKVAIAIALLRQAPVLLLDEPTSGLDPIAIDEFNRLIARLSADGVTVLMVTHDVYGACEVARRIGLLRDGTLVGTFGADGEGKIAPESVRAAFTQETPA